MPAETIDRRRSRPLWTGEAGPFTPPRVASRGSRGAERTRTPQDIAGPFTPSRGSRGAERMQTAQEIAHAG